MNAALFARQLRYWSFHCFLNAVPSLLIAVAWLKLRSPIAVSAMVCAIATFALLYAALTSFFRYLSDSGHVFSKAIRWGANFRACISGVSLLLVADEKLIMFAPDFWCGFLSFGLLQSTAKYFQPSSLAFNFLNGNKNQHSFLAIFSTTMLEGFILSFLLLLISFFALIAIQSKERRKFLKSAGFRSEPSR